LWDIKENDSIQTSSTKNPIVAQLKSHKEQMKKEEKTLFIIQTTLHDIFMKVVTMETTNSWSFKEVILRQGCKL